MNGVTETLRAQILDLPPAERAALADDLLVSIDRADSSVDARWIEQDSTRS